MFRISVVRLSVFVFSLFFAASVHAQPVLPDIIGVTQKGINILSWTAQYDGIKSISVQRSSDSIYNFSTIGYVKNLKKGPQGFIDGHPLPGKNWYRLYIAFNSDLTWYSNRFKLYIDSAQILQAGVVPPNDSLQKLVGKAITGLANVTIDTATGKTVGTIKVPVLTAPKAPVETLIKSQYVFTNPFTGHINIELPDVRTYQYSIRFFDAQNHVVLEIARLPESSLVLDKRNFQKKGLFKFELARNKEKWETGYVTIY